MDGHTAERLFAAAGIRDDESVRDSLFWRGVHVAEHRSLLPVISLIGMAAGIPQNMLLKYLGILIGIMLITYILEWKKAWVSQHEMLLMLSLLILSADIGYGLAREGVTLEAAVRQLRFGAIEAVLELLLLPCFTIL